MKNKERLKTSLINDEAFRSKPYRCSANKLTIGVGRNIEDRGISRKEGLFLLDNDIREVEEDMLGLFPRFGQFSESRQVALMNMRFQLGYRRFRKFKKMIQAVRNRDWGEVKVQAKDSKWYRQVTRRAERILKMLGEE